MLKNLYLHIGLHKTGTSSIQRFLELNKEKLKKKKSITYFTPNPWPIPFEKKRGPVVNLNINGFKILQDIETENAVTSHENYSWIISESDLEKLKNELCKYVENIHIILYLRRQDSLAISQKQEGTKWYDNSIAYGHELSAFPSKLTVFAKNYLNFYEKVKIWSNVFGLENLKIRIFEPEKLINGDVVQDFCSLLDINDITIFQKVGRVNESIPLKKQLFLHQTREFFPENSQKKHFLVKSVLKLDIGSSSDKLMPSRDEAIGFYEQFKANNKQLNDWLHLSENKYLFSDDFSKYPQESNSEELDGRFLSSVFSHILDDCLDNYIEKEKIAHMLRDIALNIEDENPAVALEIMDKALELKPHGKLIRKKVKEYQKMLIV